VASAAPWIQRLPPHAVELALVKALHSAAAVLRQWRRRCFMDQLT
jgi:hypothetical protein